MSISHFLRLAGCALLLLIGSPHVAPAQQVQWVRSLQRSVALGSITNPLIAVAPSGDFAVAAYYQGQPCIDNLILPAVDSGSAGLLLMRFNRDGDLLNSRVFYRSWSIRALAFDAADNLFTVGVIGNTGALRDTMSIADTVVRFERQTIDYLATKWAPDGHLIWARTGSNGHGPQSAAQVMPQHMTIDPAGSCVIVGTWNLGYNWQTSPTDSAWFGTQHLIYNGVAGNTDQNIFCLKLSAAGDTEWVRTSKAGAGVSQEMLDIGSDAGGNIYLFGSDNTQNWEGHSLTATTPARHIDWTPFWLKLDSNGHWLANRELPTIPPVIGYYTFNLAVAASGNSYLSYTTGIAGSAPVPSQFAIAFMKLNPAGVTQWADSLAGDGGRFASTRLAVREEGGGLLCATGFFASLSTVNAPIGYDTLTVELPQRNAFNNRSQDGYALGIDPATGAGRFLYGLGGRGEESLVDVGVDSLNQVKVIGISKSDSTHLGGHVLMGPVNWGTGVQYNGGTRVVFAKISSEVNQMPGRLFLDANGNGLQEAGERPHPFYRVVEVTPSSTGSQYFSAHETSGEFTALAGIGTFQVGLPVPPLYHTIATTGPATSTFAGFGLAAPPRTIALRPVPGQQDLLLIMTRIGWAQPGSQVAYQLTWHNIGTTTIATGRAELTFNSALHYDSAMMSILANVGPLPIRAGNKLTWNYTTLRPGQTQRRMVVFVVDTTTLAGDSIVATAQVLPIVGDLTPGNNVAASRCIAGAPLDPNAIEVSHERLSLPQVAAGEWLDYTIHFENVGTAPATNVVILDTLPLSLVNGGTIQLLAMSHPGTWRLTSGGVLMVEFSGIHLPFEGIAAQGFVHLRIKPMSSLTMGSVIANRAQIRFDYAVPVPTNTALTHIGTSPTGLPSGTRNELSGNVWPNPAQGMLNLEARLPVAGIVRVLLLDATGRLVRTQQQSAAAGRWEGRMLTTGLPAGLYFLDMRMGNIRFNRQIVVTGAE